MIGIACFLDQALHVVEGHAVVEALLDERRVDQRRRVVTRDQEGARIRRLVDATAKVGQFFRCLRYAILHQRPHVDTERRGFGVARFFGGDRQDLIVIDARRKVDVTRQLPHLLQGVRVVDVAILALDHDGHRQRIAEIRMILEHLHEGIVLRQQVREDRLQLDVAKPDGEERGNRDKHRPGDLLVSDDPDRDPLTQREHILPRSGFAARCPMVIKEGSAATETHVATCWRASCINRRQAGPDGHDIDCFQSSSARLLMKAIELPVRYPPYDGGRVDALVVVEALQARFVNPTPP